MTTQTKTQQVTVTHTPTPWHILPNPNQPDLVQISAFPNCGPVLLVMAHHPLGRHVDNAEFIVQAVNTHAPNLARIEKQSELIQWFLDACESGELKPRDNDAATLRHFNNRITQARALL